MSKIKFIKNVDISRKYSLSKPTITRWVELAIERKNNLQLVNLDNKFKILDNSHNWAELARLALVSEKYKYSHIDKLKEVDIKDSFYTIYNPEEIAEIYNHLETKREISDKFIYKDQGAKIWDEFYSENEISKQWSIPYIVEELLILAIPNLLYHIENFQVNLLDLGTGNSRPIKKFLVELTKKLELEKYFGVDISPEMLTISKKNMNEWFKTLKYQEFVCDLENINFSNFFLKNKDENTVNLIVHTGGTISNHTDRHKVIKNIRNAMGINDIFVFSCTLDSIYSRSELSHMQTPEADEQDTFVPKLLDIDVDNCSFEVFFDELNHRKVKTIKLDKDYLFNFQIADKNKKLHLRKNEEIIVWQHYLMDKQIVIKELEGLRLDPVTTIQDKTGKQMLVVCKTK